MPEWLTDLARATRQAKRKVFREAVEAVPSVADAYAVGLRGLTDAHRRLVDCKDPRRLTGSIDLDAALVADYPNDPRWDYGIGLRDGSREHAVWIEVHGAQTSKVREVIRKLQWLKRWLAGDGEPLGRLTDGTGPNPSFVWLASGRMSLPHTTRHAKLAAQHGVYPRKRLDLA